MRRTNLRLALALTAALALVATATAQPRPGDRRGPGGPVERAVDDMRLSESKRATTLDAVRNYDDNVRRLTTLTGSSLMLKLKEVLSAEEFKKLKTATDAQPTGRPEDRRLVASDLVERILSFDANKDGKVTKDELPERMQDLLARGDTNKDGVLDKEEIKKLAAEPVRDERTGRGPRGGNNGGGGVAPAAVERALRDLNLSGSKKDAADAAVKANQENVRKMKDLARAELLLAVNDVLSEDELKKLAEAVDRQPAGNDRPPGRDRRPDGPRPDGPRPPRP